MSRPTPYAHSLPQPPALQSTIFSLNSTDTLPIFSHPNKHFDASPNPDATRILSQAHLEKFVPSSRDQDDSPPPPSPTGAPGPRSESPGGSSNVSLSGSQRRKPVPSYLAMPNALPIDHPFAPRSPPLSSDSPIVKGGIRMGRSGSESPASPATMNMEDDLFFSPPGRGTLPPPPRRNFSPVSAVSMPKNVTPRNTGAMPRTVVVNSASSMTRSMTPPLGENEEQEVLVDEGNDTHRSSTRDAVTEFSPQGDVIEPSSVKKSSSTQRSASAVTSLDRPLPSLPPDGLQPMLNGDTSQVEPSTPTSRARADHRSSSEDSPMAPKTPATIHAPTHPARVATKDGDTWDIASEVEFYDSGAKNKNGKPDSTVRVSSVVSRPITNANAALPHRTNTSSALSHRSQPKSTPSSKTEAEDETFSVDRLPTKRRLWEVGTCFLRNEDGQLVCFGDLFPRWDEGHEGRVLRNNASLLRSKDREAEKAKSASIASRRSPKTVVFFIRHFWCGQCQDYTFASLSLLDPVAIAAAGIRVIIISNGSWKIIKSYRKLFNCPFPIYVDGPRRLYQLLG